ncbi:MAG TPA: histidine kinase [Candidatus Limnocylindrales bacterium]|nr:histidine kinase [Candidatus Limnocylindrales bacterium]
MAGPSDRTAIPFYADAWTVDGVRVEAVAGSGPGLAPGDIVLGVAGRPIGSWLDGALDPGAPRAAALDAASVDYTVRRGSTVLDVPVTLGGGDVGGTLLAYWSALIFTFVLQLVAVFLLLRRPEASAAAALAVAAVGVTGSTVPWLLGLEVSDLVRGTPLLLYAATAAGLYMLLWPAGAIHLPLAMGAGPAGPGRRRVVAAYGLPLGAYAAGLVIARLASPSAAVWLGTWGLVQLAVIVPTMLVGVWLSIRTFVRAGPAVRSQIRWVLVGGAMATVPSLALLLLPELFLGRPLVPWSAVGLFALPLPIGIAAAILRDRLFDIEVAINRALVYGGATAVILTVYVASVTVLGAVLGVQGGFSASLVATGLAAVVALPIRDGLQRGVNRLMYGDRDDPYRALARLGRRLEAAIDPIEAPTVIARTVAESLRVPWAALRVGPEDETARLIEHGRRPPGEVVAVPLVYGAETVGALLVAPRSPVEPLSSADRRLLEALAGQAGPAVRAVGLTLDLIASREHLVAAGEEERRRIRRDLHDGLGPTLAAIGLRAEVAADLVARNPEEAARLLGELRTEVRGAIDDIRRLVDALRPPALDELGLVGALRAQAARLGPPPTVDVLADGPIPELPPAVEVAAYRIAVEAITNAARHAGASSCRVRVAAPIIGDERPALQLEIADDGAGLPEIVRPGIGLVSMRERAAEVGGSCVVESAPGSGTRVVARLPLGPAPSGAAA